MSEKKAPRVLIGITTRNRADILAEAVKSSCDHDYGNKSVMVIDDASTDDTPGIAIGFPEVEWIRNEEPRGYRENRNFMMGQPGIDYFVSLDDDAWFMEGDEIGLAVEFLESNPDAAAVAFDILSPDQPNPNERMGGSECASFIGCGHVIRIDSAKEADFYLDFPGSYGGEERDLCLRLMDLGYGTFLLPGVHVWHEKHWKDREWGRLHRSGVCNDLAFAARRWPFPEVIATIPLKILSHLKFAVKDRRFIVPAMQGIVRFFSQLGAILRGRRAVSRRTIHRFLSLR